MQCVIYIPNFFQKVFKNLFDLNFDEIKYLLQDKDFFLKKQLKNLLFNENITINKIFSTYIWRY